VTLLFDQNISYKITKTLSEKEKGLCIITFDADFLNLATLRGIPPKVILLKTGNRKTNQLVELLMANRELIDQFLHDIRYQNIGCLEIAK
jgi:predicted nuclease of predicted toxin-antitoxin system